MFEMCAVFCFLAQSDFQNPTVQFLLVALKKQSWIISLGSAGKIANITNSGLTSIIVLTVEQEYIVFVVKSLVFPN